MDFLCKGPNNSPRLERAGRYIGRRVRPFRSANGGALVEFALTLPFLLMLMTAIFSFSTAIYQKMLLAEAVASGGRVLAADRGDTNPCATTAAAIAAAAPNLTGLTYAFSINGGTVTGASCTGAAGATKMVTGGTAMVSAAYTCTIRVYRYSFPSCTLASTITEEVQ